MDRLIADFDLLIERGRVVDGTGSPALDGSVGVIGIDWVIVNGTVVVAEGEHTGATPGRALRRGRA